MLGAYTSGGELGLLDVWVLSFEAPTKAAAELGSMFDMPAPNAHKLVSSVPFAIQEGAEVEAAEALKSALVRIGANVELRNTDGSVYESLVADPARTPAPRAAPPRVHRAPKADDSSQPGIEAWEKPALRKSEIPAALEGKPSLSARPPAMRSGSAPGSDAKDATAEEKKKKKKGNSEAEKTLAKGLMAVMVLAVAGAVAWLSMPGEPAFERGVGQVDGYAAELIAGGDHYDPREWLAEGKRVMGCPGAVASTLVDAVDAAGATEMRFSGYASLGGEPHVRKLVITVPNDGGDAIRAAVAEALSLEGGREPGKPWLEIGSRYYIVHFDG